MICLLAIGAAIVAAPIQDPVSTVFGTRAVEKTVIVLEDDEFVKSNWKSLYAIRDQGQRRFSSSIFKETVPYVEKRGLHRLKSGHWLYVPQFGHGLLVDYHRTDFTKVAILPILFKSNFRIPKPGVNRMGDISPIFRDYLLFSFSQKFSNFELPFGSALDTLPCMCTIRNEVTFSSGGQKVTFSPSAQSPSRRTEEDRIKDDEVFKGRELQFKYKPSEMDAITRAIFTDPAFPASGLDFHAFKTRGSAEISEDSVGYCLDQMRNCLVETRLEANSLSKALVEKLKAGFPEVFGPYKVRRPLSEFPKETQDHFLEGLKSASGGAATDDEKANFRSSATIASTRIGLGIYFATVPRGDYYGTEIWLDGAQM